MNDIHWYFSQVKGTAEEEIAEPDVISCLEFNNDGNLLATGDKGGRIVVFQKDLKKVGHQLSSEYNVYCTFQSHEPEFDYLKSLEIEEKINKIQWLRHSYPAHFLLSTNDKTIKLWRIGERLKEWEGRNLAEEEMVDPSSITQLLVPTHKPIDLTVEVSPRKIYANAHAYHINSVSTNSDQETFLSADDLRINLWHLNISNTGFNIVNLKPASMEELTEVITSAIFHPTHCNLLAYGSSRGHVRLCDMRSQALCDKHAKMYEDGGDLLNGNFFAEIISSISDVKFSFDGRFLLTRDYLTLKVWDLKMESHPVETYHVHDHLRSKLCLLYENDSIFDKFDAAWSPDDRFLLTGSYDNLFRVFERQSSNNYTYEASRQYVNETTRQPLKCKKIFTLNNKKKRDEVVYLESMNFTKKILHPAWHPEAPTLAIAATNNLYIFDGVAPQSMEI